MTEHSPDGVSLVAVCAMSGSVALLAFQAYKRLLSDFMMRMEHELGGSGKSGSRRPRVRFTAEPSLCESEHHIAEQARANCGSGQLSSMPINRQVLYRGILQYRNVRAHHMSDSF